MSSLTIAMQIKEIMANMPDSINTKNEIEEYYKNAMKDLQKKNSKIHNAFLKTKKSTKKVCAVNTIDNRESVLVSQFTKNIINNNLLLEKKLFKKNINNPKKAQVVISNINVEKPKIIDVISPKVSQFTKDIEQIADLLKSNKILKKNYKNILIDSEPPSFCDEILAAAFKINNKLISDKRLLYNNQHT
jgi:hypothetical protein